MSKKFAPGFQQYYDRLTNEGKLKCDEALEHVCKNPTQFPCHMELDFDRVYKTNPYPPGANKQYILMLQFNYTPGEARVFFRKVIERTTTFIEIRQ